jgi:orotate phosphoribosyltransferase-like protein
MSKETEIQVRRDRVFELSSKGLNQTEIADKLNYSQQTVSNDLAYLHRKAKENLTKGCSDLAYQYEEALTNLRALRKEAWILLEQTKDDRIKVSLYGVIQHINESILQTLAAADVIAQELIADSQSAAEQGREELQEIMLKQKKKNNNEHQELMDHKQHQHNAASQ